MLRWNHLRPVVRKGGYIKAVEARAAEMWRLQRFVYNRLGDGDKVASLMRRPRFTPRNIPDTRFYYR
jgi:hypothetical protein